MGLFDRFRRRRKRTWAARATARVLQRTFAAAETPPWTDSWATTALDLNAELQLHLGILRARSRTAARDNEWARRYLLQLRDNVLGPAGIALQMRLKDPSGALLTDDNDRIERAWRDWGRRGNCEVSGRHSWAEIEGLLLETLARDGEILYRHVPGRGPHGYQIQLLPTEVLDHELHREDGGRRIRMGIEIDDLGRPLAYWLRAHRVGDTDPTVISVGRHVRVPAEQIVHRFQAEEPNQLRGYPWLATGARRLWLLNDFEESAAVASSNAAKRQGFFVSPNGEPPPGFADQLAGEVIRQAQAEGRSLSDQDIQDILASAAKYATTQPGQYDTLPVGYDYRPNVSEWPKIDAATYVKQQLRGWAAARGVSYVTLGNDLEAVNYSSARVGILDEREHYKGIQARFLDWVHEPISAAWLRHALLAVPDLAGLAYDRLPEYLDARTWQPRRWQGIDPLKEAQAAELLLRLGLTSRRRLILERGDDPDEVAAEIAAEEPLPPPAAAASP